jgi:hypothetical protein
MVALRHCFTVAQTPRTDHVLDAVGELRQP